MRFVLALVLSVPALIHLLGFANAFESSSDVSTKIALRRSRQGGEARLKRPLASTSRTQRRGANCMAGESAV
jgi:hypothetical protein